jgi:hypothetical protein
MSINLQDLTSQYVAVWNEADLRKRDKGLVVRLSGESSRHHGIAKFYWEIVDPKADAVVALGFDVLRLDESGRIAADHQFVEQLATRT